MPEILSRGELSFVFIDGKFSHAVQKTVARNNWLAHDFFAEKTSITRQRSPKLIGRKMFMQDFRINMGIFFMLE